MDVNRKNGVTEAKAKETIIIQVQILSPYVGKIKCAVNAERVEIRSPEYDSIELDVKAQKIEMEDIPEGTAFAAVTKGIGTSISYEKDGMQAENFSTPGADNIIEPNGIKSELVACVSKEI